MCSKVHAKDDISLFLNFRGFSFSTKLKKSKWSSIANEVSNLGPERSVEQCKKKLADMKSISKAKAAR